MEFYFLLSGCKCSCRLPEQCFTASVGETWHADSMEPQCLFFLSVGVHHFLPGPQSHVHCLSYFLSYQTILTPTKSNSHHCRGPASAGSRGYPQDEGRRQEREKTCETSLDRAKSAREGEREIERERERERDQTGGAESGRVWQCFIFYHSFYTLS